MNIRIDIPENAWEPTGSDDDSTSRLTFRRSMLVNGQNFHVEAYAVTNETPEGDQGACDAEFAPEVTMLQEMVGGRELTTQSICGRDYVIAFVPHGVG